MGRTALLALLPLCLAALAAAGVAADGAKARFDALLASGAVPLPTLERQVDAFIARSR